MEKTQKKQVVEELNHVFKESGGVVLVDFTGISVADETELRRKISAVESSYRVVKNTLARRAAKETPVAQLETHFSGPTAVVYSQQNPVGLAKVITAFVKDHPLMSVKGGVLEEAVLAEADVKTLADMPTREELLSKLVYLLQAPVSQLATALQSPLRNLASLLSQLEGRK